MAEELMHDDHDPTPRIITLLASRLERLVKKDTLLLYLRPPPGGRPTTVFDGPAEPRKREPLSTSLLDYLQDFYLDMESLPVNYVHAGIHVERFLRMNPSVPITVNNVRRLVLAGLAIAIKLYEFYLNNDKLAVAGRVTVKEMCDIEEAMVLGVDFDCDVDAEEFDAYCSLLLREELKSKSNSTSTSAPSASASASDSSASAPVWVPPLAPCCFFRNVCTHSKPSRSSSTE